MASLAIVQTLTDNEMTSPKEMDEVLAILRAAFACTSRCVPEPSDRQPRAAFLFLEHSHSNASKQMQTRIDETKKFIIQQAPGVE